MRIRIMLVTVLLLGGLGLTGCSIQRTLFKEVYTDGTITTYKSTLLIPPGGKLDKSAGAMSYKFGKNGENLLMVGQDTSGADNTQQGDVVRAIGEMLEGLAEKGVIKIVK